MFRSSCPTFCYLILSKKIRQVLCHLLLIPEVGLPDPSINSLWLLHPAVEFRSGKPCQWNLWILDSVEWMSYSCLGDMQGLSGGIWWQSIAETGFCGNKWLNQHGKLNPRWKWDLRSLFLSFLPVLSFLPSLTQSRLVPISHISVFSHLHLWFNGS